MCCCNIDRLFWSYWDLLWILSWPYQGYMCMYECILCKGARIWPLEMIMMMAGVGNKTLRTSWSMKLELSHALGPTSWQTSDLFLHCPLPPAHHCPSARWIVMSGAGQITNTISGISQRKYALPWEGSILEVIYGHIILLITHKALLSAECILLKWKVIFALPPRDASLYSTPCSILSWGI